MIHSFTSFLKRYLHEYNDIVPLAGDASTRAYFRVRAGKETYILCRDVSLIGKPLEEYTFKIVHGLFSQHHVPVPNIIAYDNSEGLVLEQDLGEELLESACSPLDREQIVSYYKKALDILAGIQGIRGDGVPFRIGFNADKLMYEFIFFIVHTLMGYYKISLSDADTRGLKNEFSSISRALDRPDFFVLNHRDYQARNLMLFNDSLYVIDFQDARMGLPHYDLVSLLRDPYVHLDDGMLLMLKDHYYEISRSRHIHDMDRETFEYYFDLMAFQRNVKALGTYGYMAAFRGKRQFEKYIRPCINYLHSYADRRDELKKAWGMLRIYLS